jgi:glycosyltransferase involved in cell wall biosynthesis
MISFCILTNSGLAEHAHREGYLHRLLSSIKVLEIPSEQYEVLIGGAIPQGIECSERVSMPQAAQKGEICKIRNALIDRAKSDTLVLCDDDVLFTPDYWLRIKEFMERPWDILCTGLLNPNGTRYWDWAAHYKDLGQTLVPYDKTDPQMYATGGHAIYRRAVFEKIRWNESLGHGSNEEFDLAQQAREYGFIFAIQSHVTVFLQYHHCDAAAVIAGRPQCKTQILCPAYKRAQDAADEITSRTIQKQRPVVWERISRKLRPIGRQKVGTTEVSIVVCAYRYLQRFRLFAQGLIAQKCDAGRLEVCVANPGSPDGLSSYLQTLNAAVGEKGPRFVEVPVDEKWRANRGALIQKAFEQSSGKIVIGMDCDIVVPENFVDRIVSTLGESPLSVVGIYRNFLSENTTSKILAGMIDPVTRFNELLSSEDETEAQGYRGVLGYCQAAIREAWESAGGYPTEFDDIARSDVAFVDQLVQLGYKPVFLENVRALHLHHPRNWSGTSDFL